MSDSVNESPSPKDRALIREILMRDWDPIGVRDIPGSRKGEYDAYINNVYTLVVDEHAPQEKISAYLQEVQTQMMHLRVTDAALERCGRAAQSLIAVRSQLAGRADEPT
jgi:hypothetical protein